MNKKVTILVPCRNEIKYMSNFLDSLLQNDYPKELMEIIIIDGMSNDGTKKIIEEYIEKYTFIKLIDNPEKNVSNAMNIGIKNSSGELIIRLDVHAIYPNNYISQLVYYSYKLDADNVGGFLETLPSDNSFVSKSIAISLSSSFGVGNAEYRIQSKKEKEYFETDTVPFGCYKKDIFDKIGLYDEDLVRNQDNELNERLKNNGGKIYIIPSIVIKYYARESYFKLYKMMFQYGYFGPLVDMKLKKATRLRRYIPFLFILSLIIPLIFSFFLKSFYLLSLLSFTFYITTNFVFSLREAKKNNNLDLIIYIFIANLTSHFGYGIGYFKGLIDFPLLKKHTKKLEINLSR